MARSSNLEAGSGALYSVCWRRRGKAIGSISWRSARGNCWFSSSFELDLKLRFGFGFQLGKCWVGRNIKMKRTSMDAQKIFEHAHDKNLKLLRCNEVKETQKCKTRKLWTDTSVRVHETRLRQIWHGGSLWLMTRIQKRRLFILIWKLRRKNLEKLSLQKDSVPETVTRIIDRRKKSSSVRSRKPADE